MSQIQERLRSLLPWFLQRGQECSHVQLIQDVTPSADGCEDCLKIGYTWVHHLHPVF